MTWMPTTGRCLTRVLQKHKGSDFSITPSSNSLQIEGLSKFLARLLRQQSIPKKNRGTLFVILLFAHMVSDSEEQHGAPSQTMYEGHSMSIV